MKKTGTKLLSLLLAFLLAFTTLVAAVPALTAMAADVNLSGDDYYLKLMYPDILSFQGSEKLQWSYAPNLDAYQNLLNVFLARGEREGCQVYFYEKGEGRDLRLEVAPYVNAASSGAAMPADLVATARPANMVTATYPSSKAVMENFFWEKYLFDLSAIGGKSYDIVLLGDSITQKWFFNLGRTGDFTENLLWRLEGGCLDGYTTKFFNLLIGTNNTIQREPAKDDPADIAAGVKAVLDLVLAKHPESKVLLMPILPYGYTNAQHNATGMAQYANNEAANEIIKTYADGQRVILVDVRSQFLNADGTFKGEMYLEKDGDYPDMFLHLSAKGYREIMAPAISAAMAAAGASSVALPALDDVTAQVNGTSATISLSGVTKGTDANGAAASSYSVVSKLDTDAEATVLSGQSGATASFSLADLADGWHSCAVMVKTGDGMVSAPKRVKFQVDSQADAVGWKVAPMTADGSAIRGGSRPLRRRTAAMAGASASTTASSTPSGGGTCPERRRTLPSSSRGLRPDASISSRSWRATTTTAAA